MNHDSTPLNMIQIDQECLKKPKLFESGFMFRTQPYNSVTDSWNQEVVAHAVMLRRAS